jgi:hypothetical protein
MKREPYVQGQRNPTPMGWEYEALMAEIERRPFCNIRSRQIILWGN